MTSRGDLSVDIHKPYVHIKYRVLEDTIPKTVFFKYTRYTILNVSRIVVLAKPP